MGRTLFVSYSRNDQDQVTTLTEDLAGFDHEPWMDNELTGGQDWWREVLKRIRDCDLFIFAVSHASVTSEACDREYEYAAALGKPVLPVTVRTGASDALLPAALGNIQRVDYSEPDRADLTRLIKAINGMPEAGQLPETLPPEPEIPATYLYDLNQEIGGSEEMSSAKQDEILRQLEHQTREGDTPQAVRHMVDRMRQRPDLLVRSSDRLNEIEASLATGASKEETQPKPDPPLREEPTQTQEQRPPPGAGQGQSQQPPPAAGPAQGATPPRQPTPPAGQTGTVNGAWWIAVILIPIFGGVVAWLVNKDIDPKTSRNMLITGIVWGVVVALFGGY